MSVHIALPCVMIGSPSLPSQQSSSMHLHPASSTCLYLNKQINKTKQRLKKIELKLNQTTFEFYSFNIFTYL